MRKDDFTDSSCVLYKVDPLRLSIKQVNTEYYKHNDVTTTHENFAIDNQNASIKELNPPFEVEGMFYFKTKDEAISFIRLRMGMQT